MPQVCSTPTTTYPSRHAIREDKPHSTISQTLLLGKMHFDEILSLSDSFGPYQKRVYFLLCLLSIPRAWHNLGQVFLGGSVDHWCSTAEPDYVNCTYWELDEKQCGEAKRDAAIPISADGKFEKCVKYNLTGIVFYPGINTTAYTNHTMSCSDGWDYDDSQYESTIITDVREY